MTEPAIEIEPYNQKLVRNRNKDPVKKAEAEVGKTASIQMSSFFTSDVQTLQLLNISHYFLNSSFTAMAYASQ